MCSPCTVRDDHRFESSAGGSTSLVLNMTTASTPRVASAPTWADALSPVGGGAYGRAAIAVEEVLGRID